MAFEKTFGSSPSATAGPVAYGVVGLTMPIEDMIHNSHLPLLVTTVLLPFHDQIVYDGLLGSNNVHFGPELKIT